MARNKERAAAEKKPNSGRSKSSEYPFGKRRVQGGMELAPKSLRHKYKTLKECPDEALEKAEVK